MAMVEAEGAAARIARSNGRIEATEIDSAAKTAGRIKQILLDEGDFVRAGQAMARMDTAVLVAQRKEAEAQQPGVGGRVLNLLML
jgi:HlyD family secretion protein